MGLKEKGLKAGIWNWLSMIVNQLRNFIVSIILARLLAPEDFGLLGMSLAFAGFVEVFVDFGFGSAVIQADNVSKKQLSTVFYLNFIVGILLTGVMFLCAPLIATYFEMPQLTQICRVMSFTFIVLALSNLQNALLKKKMDFKTPFYINTASGFITAILGIVMAYCGFGVWSLVWSTVSGWCITTCLLWILSGWRPSFEFELGSVIELWRFGYKNSLTWCIDSIYRKIDTLVIGKVFSAATLGLFYRAQSLNQLVVQYSFSSISTVLFPAFCEIKDNKERMRYSVQSLLHVVCFLTFLFSGLMYVCAHEIIVILYTDKWVGAVDIFKILGLFSFCFTLPTIFGTPLMSLGYTGQLLKIEVAKKIILSVAIIIGIYCGLYGYVYATQIGAAFGILINMYFMKYIDLSMNELIRIFCVYLLPFVILIAGVEFIGSYLDINIYVSLILKALIYTSLYFGYTYAVKTKGIEIFYNSMVKPLLHKLKL